MLLIVMILLIKVYDSINNNLKMVVMMVVLIMLYDSINSDLKMVVLTEMINWSCCMIGNDSIKSNLKMVVMTDDGGFDHAVW